MVRIRHSSAIKKPTYVFRWVDSVRKFCRKRLGFPARKSPALAKLKVPDASDRSMKVERILYQPEASGDFHL